jgi:polysaccharide deacetylase 2 family uncharacterized protein YibQ
MERRDFLFGCGSLLSGILSGSFSPSQALAFGDSRSVSDYQPRLALIIDDIGHSRPAARQFLELGVPITFSVLPRLAHSYDLAREVHRLGHEVMLHQPMEPHHPYVDPGPGALYVGDSPETIIRITNENISSLPSAVGVNNHMGSRFTECPHEISNTLRVVGESNLFYIDSLTTSLSKAYETARRLHLPAARRDIFLDNVQTESHILSQLRRLERRARNRGQAIGIGHPFPETARAIARFLRHVKDPCVALVHVSSVMYT